MSIVDFQPLVFLSGYFFCIIYINFNFVQEWHYSCTVYISCNPSDKTLLLKKSLGIFYFSKKQLQVKIFSLNIHYSYHIFIFKPVYNTILPAEYSGLNISTCILSTFMYICDKLKSLNIWRGKK